MKTRPIWALALCILFAPTAAHARDDRLKFPLAEVLGSADAKAKLDPQIRLYFGAQKSAAPTKQLGTFTANKKTNFFNKSDKDACQWAFLSAAISLQERARKEGGNAVINIQSVYKNEIFVSETEYQCGAGTVTGGVALRGDVVLLP
jgi:hypothetical protein